MRAIGFAPSPAPAPAPPPAAAPPPDFDFKVFAAMMKAAERLTIALNAGPANAAKAAPAAKFIEGFGYAN